MTFTETDSTRRGIAFHEAGHAVVAWTLGQRVSSIRIHAESNRETSGTMRSKKQRYGSRALQMLFEAHESCRDIAPAIQIVVSFAGVLAQMQVEEEALQDHVFDVAAFSDRQEMNRLLAAMDCTDEQRASRVRLLGILCSDYLFQHWKHVEDLARALLANGRIVKAKEIRQILGPRTMPLRTAIEGVRQALEASDH